MKELQIVAEVGSNWWRPDMDEAKAAAAKSVRVAAECGATAVKFQLFDADTLYSKERAPDLYDRAAQFELPLPWLVELRSVASEIGVELWASVFSIDLVSPVAKWLDCIKIASGDLVNGELVNHAAWVASRERVKLAISAGAATMEEIEDTLSWIAGVDIPEVVLFHCVSVYPASPYDYNLLAGLEFAGGVDRIGLSDHTLGHRAAEIACALGYSVFEKHFALGDTPISLPDIPVSLSPANFKRYIVEGIKGARKIMGSGEKVVLLEEEAERIWARRGSDGLRPVEQ